MVCADNNNIEKIAVKCKEGSRIFQVDKRISNMSPLFTEVLDDLNEESSANGEVMTLDFA